MACRRLARKNSAPPACASVKSAPVRLVSVRSALRRSAPCRLRLAQVGRAELRFAQIGAFEIRALQVGIYQFRLKAVRARVNPHRPARRATPPSPPRTNSPRAPRECPTASCRSRESSAAIAILRLSITEYAHIHPRDEIRSPPHFTRDGGALHPYTARQCPSACAKLSQMASLPKLAATAYALGAALAIALLLTGPRARRSRIHPTLPTRKLSPAFRLAAWLSPS